MPTRDDMLQAIQQAEVCTELSLAGLAARIQGGVQKAPMMPSSSGLVDACIAALPAPVHSLPLRPLTDLFAENADHISSVSSGSVESANTPASPSSAFPFDFNNRKK